MRGFRAMPKHSNVLWRMLKKYTAKTIAQPFNPSGFPIFTAKQSGTKGTGEK
jgi:hypothetical protein